MGNSKFKKIALILGFLIIVFLLGILIWNTFFRKDQPTITPPTEIIIDPITGLPISPEGEGQIIVDEEGRPITPSPDIEIQPQAPTIVPGQIVNPTASGGLTQTETLVTSSTLNPTLGRDGGSIQFYDRSDGKFYTIDSNGNLVALSNRVFHNVQDIVWAPNKTKAVLEYPDGNKIVYDFASEKQVTLPKHWEDFSFSSDSSKLVNKSLGLDPDNRWLIMSNSDGSQSRAIEFIGTNDEYVIPSWSPNNQSIAMYTRGLDFNRREVFFVGQHNENFKSTIIEGWGFDPLWSENGDKLLYSVYSPQNELKPNIWIVNAVGDDIGINRKNLQLETWAEKCTFASNTDVYCAVPRELPEGAGLFPEIADRVADDLYKINIQTGQKELIAIPDINFNISGLMVDTNQNYIFFTDKATGRIHKIQLQ